jgi:nucleotide-binding universal stress UspA family protein
MQIQDIFVALANKPDADRGRDLALALAQAYGAHVTGVSYALEPVIQVSPFGELPGDIIQRHVNQAVEAAEEAITEFAKAARKAGVSAAQHSVRAPVAQAADDLSKRARTHDLTVLTQSTSGIEHFGDVFAEAALFYSGRPVLFAPREGIAQRVPFERALIAWDGGPCAARAVACAMPLLEGAKEIGVLTVEEPAKGQTRAAELVRHLQRHRLPAGIHQHQSDDIGGTLLREVELARAGLLVMGGYGHSRLREFVFGGVTRFVLANMKTPVLMAH